MPTFRPSVVLNFKLYFDEILNPTEDLPAPHKVDTRVTTPPRGRASNASAQPLITQRSDLAASFVYARIPKTASVELPGYRQAGKLTATLDFRDMPIDPRTVRAAACEVHIGTVSHGDFAEGMVRANPDGSRKSVLQTRDSSGNIRQDTLRGVFYIDEWKVDEGSRGAEVTFTGRDMRAPLIETPLGTDPSVAQQILDELDLSQDIKTVVLQLLRYNPLFDEFNVACNIDEWPNSELPSPRAQDLIPRHRQGARGQRAGGRASMPGDSNQMSFWDLITNLCFVCGAIPYFQNTTLLIRPARSIFDQARAGFDPRVATPFKNGQARTVEGVGTFNVRRLVYGKDVESLSFTRKFGGFAKPKTVRCVSVSFDKTQRGLDGLSIQAQWPAAEAAEGARRNRVAPGGQQAQEEILTVPVPGIRSQERLLECAKNLYEQIARLEMGGECSTKNMSSFGGDNDDPDLLRLQPGDAVEFWTDVRELSSRQPLASTVTDHYRTPFESQVDEIAKRLGDRNLAQVIVKTARGQVSPIQRAFRVSTVKYDWAADPGNLGVSFDFQNYFEARAIADSVGTKEGAVAADSVPRTEE